MHLKELKKKTSAELVEMAEEYGVEGASTLLRQDLMFAILKEVAEDGEEIMGLGTIEVLPDGFGFLRSPEANFLAGPDDIYVSPNQVRKFGLRTGDTVEGEIRAPKDGERYFALTKLTTVNFDDPDVVRHRVNFDNLTPLYPDEKLRLDTLDPTVKDKSARVIDIVSPQGKGQRTLIVAPPRVGKTVLLQNIAKAITDNHPEVFLIVLLIDERPEEVTDMQRSVKGEVVSSTLWLQGGILVGLVVFIRWMVASDAGRRLAERLLLSLPNALCTPHLGYNDFDAFDRFYTGAVNQLLAFAEGKPIDVLNPEALRRG